MMKTEIGRYVGAAAKKLFNCEADFDVLVPENENFGHYSTNAALKLAKDFKQNPMEIAENLKSQISNLKFGFFEKIEVAQPGFVNFWISPKILRENIKEILCKKEKFGAGENKRKTIVVEYSSPNIAKPLGIHHLSPTILGQALVNILRFSGYEVVSLSFPGDWGTQFGLLIAGYKRWGSKEKVNANPIDELLNLYVKFSSAAKENPELLDEGRNEFKKLEDGDKENLELWKWFSKVSMDDFEKVYKMLGVKIENTIPESYYEPELKSLVEEAVKKGVAKKGEDNSIIIPIPGSETPEIIQKSDGATIYTTRELAAIRHRFKKWKADKILYLGDNRQQAFHLSQVFKCAELLGLAKPGQLEHIKFGMMLAQGGEKFATREGKLIKLEDVLKEAIKRSGEIVEKLNAEISEKEKEKIAKIVGTGALKFFDLSRTRSSDIIFDWDKMLSLKGASAPYIQYAYARLKNVVKKSGVGARWCGFFAQKFDASLLKTKEELDLIFHLSRFGEAVEDSARAYEPSKIAEYLLRLAEKANIFYEKSPVLRVEKSLMMSRLALIEATSAIIKSGLNLLGIEVMGKM